MARVPYNPVPTVAPTGAPDVFQRIPAATPEAFGGLIGQAEQKFGASAEQASNEMAATAIRFQEMHNATVALNATTAASQELGQVETNFRQLKGLNAVNGLKSYQDQVAAIQSKYGDGLNPMAKLAFLRDFRSNANRSLVSMGIHAGDQADNAHIGTLQASIAEAQSRMVRYAAQGGTPDMHDIVDLTAQLGQFMGWDKNQTDHMLQVNMGEGLHRVIDAQLAADGAQGATYGTAAKASALLHQYMGMNVPGTDVPLLDAKQIDDISTKIQTKQYMALNREVAQLNKAEILSRRHLEENQRTNFASMYADALQGKTPSTDQLADAVRSQRINPMMERAISAVGLKSATDDPGTIARINGRIGRREDATDDILQAATDGLLKGPTVSALLKASSTSQRGEEDKLVSGLHESLKAALGAPAGTQFDFTKEGDKAKAALLGQAEAEWAQRIYTGREDPQQVYGDIVQKYQKALPSDPTALMPNPKFGMVQSNSDVASVAIKTQQAFDAGQLTPAQFEEQQQLLMRYRGWYQQQEAAQEAAKAKRETTGKPAKKAVRE